MSTDSASKSKIILCKVCAVVVPRRKEYHPKICEACQKFFRRNCSRRSELFCSGGAHNCVVAATSRRCCPRCRFEKCLAVGMQSKLLNCSELNGNASDTASSSSGSGHPSDHHQNFINDQASVSPRHESPIFRKDLAFFPDAAFFKGTAVEHNIRTAAENLNMAQLNAYNFSAQQTMYPACEVAEVKPNFLNMGAQQVNSIYEMATNFEQQMAALQGYGDRQIYDLLMNSFLRQASASYQPPSPVAQPQPQLQLQPTVAAPCLPNSLDVAQKMELALMHLFPEYQQQQLQRKRPLQW